MFALLFAAAIHDYRHPGLSNAYLVANNHDIAITYNDNSVLENFHVAQAFHLAHRMSDNGYGNCTLAFESIANVCVCGQRAIV